MDMILIQVSRNWNLQRFPDEKAFGNYISLKEKK